MDDILKQPKELENKRAASEDMKEKRAELPIVDNANANAHDNTDAIRERIERKKTFLNFTRVLMIYLENHDKVMHSKAKSIIRKCAKKNKKNESATNASLSVTMQVCLRDLVGEVYWKDTENYLCQLIQKNYQKKDGMDPHAALQKARKAAKIAASPLPDEGENFRRISLLGTAVEGDVGVQVDDHRQQQHHHGTTRVDIFRDNPG